MRTAQVTIWIRLQLLLAWIINIGQCPKLPVRQIDREIFNENFRTTQTFCSQLHPEQQHDQVLNTSLSQWLCTGKGPRSRKLAHRTFSILLTMMRYPVYYWPPYPAARASTSANEYFFQAGRVQTGKLGDWEKNDERRNGRLFTGSRHCHGNRDVLQQWADKSIYLALWSLTFPRADAPKSDF